MVCTPRWCYRNADVSHRPQMWLNCVCRSAEPSLYSTDAVVSLTYDGYTNIRSRSSRLPLLPLRGRDLARSALGLTCRPPRGSCRPSGSSRRGSAPAPAHSGRYTSSRLRLPSLTVCHVLDGLHARREQRHRCEQFAHNAAPSGPAAGASPASASSDRDVARAPVPLRRRHHPALGDLEQPGDSDCRHREQHQATRRS